MKERATARAIFDRNDSYRILAGKTAIVTGGTTGIGRATALALAGHGVRVLIFGRHRRELYDALNDIGAAGEVHGMLADQAKHADVLRVFVMADQKLGPLDIIVNNAAVGGEPLLDSEYEDWVYVIQTNLIGCMDCCQQAVKRMQRRRQGHVVNIGSLSAEFREAEEDVYTATKAGLQGFTESLRKSVNKNGIKVTLIEPGLVGTDMVEMSPRSQRREEAKAKMLKAEDIAESILYSLSQPRRSEVVHVRVREHQGQGKI